MTARDKDNALCARLARRGMEIGPDDARTLRRAALTLTRWAEDECGGGNAYASWAIERDEVSGKPFRVIYPHKGETRRQSIPDRETATLNRVRKLCAARGVFFFHQTDPRGCALYVSAEPLAAEHYPSGVAIY